jgi:trimethylamine--corrinoid protein Co-methyltransferase
MPNTDNLTMAKPELGILSQSDVLNLHDASIRILERTGVRVLSDEVLSMIEGREGITIDRANQVVKFNETAVMEAVACAPSSFTVYGRDLSKSLTYGQDEFFCQAIPGQTMWVDPQTRSRRPGTLADFEKSIKVADALENIDIVGAMIQPAEIPIGFRDVYQYAELFKRTLKPARSFVQFRRAAHYILEMAIMLAGDAATLARYPLIEFGFEPVSPLLLPGEPLETALDFAQAGIPLTIGPMPLAMGTAPVTLSGAVVLGNAEVLATMTIVQTVAPGTPVIYYNSPHILDARTMNIVFGSPEQSLMGSMVAALGKHYRLPIGLNVGLTDAKLPDAQSGMEKGMTMLIGALAGADIFGGMGISGADQGFSLPQLIIDNEIIGFVKRSVQGVRIDAEAIASEVIEKVGISGSYLVEDHTLDHWREEFWLPQMTDRDNWDRWLANGGQTMMEKAIDRQDQIIQEHDLPWADENLQLELDAVVAAARQEILGE